ncbi:MAG: glucohydrolase [Clostridiaceae bacterium]|jgi:oligo-1,6-glucosidase|nr:glucohydrolase [Clostridiaceae bacterium]
MNKAWWKESVVYQIYPRSFKDSNGDGIGDLNGIIEKLDYVKELGADMIWLNPIYKSPNDDNGYDISDYEDIMDEFGSMEDFDNLLLQCHKRGIRVMMDLVVNHTSDEHKWFKESRKSKDNPYSDYYIWKNGRENEKPNNWGSFFGGSAWEYEENRDEYYLHIFSKKQPDLNWDNPKVRKDVYNVIKFWLDKGIDGFRMDAINIIGKHDDLPDGTILEGYKYADGTKYFMNQPKVHNFLHEMNKNVISKYDVVTVGETSNVDTKEALNYIADNREEMNMIFQFEHIALRDVPYDKWEDKPVDVVKLKNILTRWQMDLQGNGWNSLYWNNHDKPRAVSNFGNDREYRIESAKMLATCMYLMQGTPYIYQGEEIGMTNANFQQVSDYKDIHTLNCYNEFIHKGMTHEQLINVMKHLSRDNSRTPMQWNKNINAGFSETEPWIKVNSNYININVETERKNPNSVLNYYKKLLKLRKENEVAVYGDYKLILEKDKQIFSYVRTLKNESMLIICNFTYRTPFFRLPKDIKYSSKELLLCNYENKGNDDLSGFKLRPYECRAYKLNL